MTKAILDTSFIMTAVSQRIDFFSELEDMGFKPLMPDQVLNELNSLTENEKSKVSYNAQIALKIIKSSEIERIAFEGKNVDNAIIKFANENPKVAVATLDKEIKDKVKNQKIVIRGKNKLDVI